MTFSHLPEPRWRGPQAHFYFGLRSPQGGDWAEVSDESYMVNWNWLPANSASQGKCGCAIRQGFQGMGGLHPLIEWF